MKRAAQRLAFLALGLGPELASCATGDSPQNTTLPTNTPAPTSTGFADAAPPPRARTECAEETQQVYVIATDKVLYRFLPQTLEFVRVGTVACPTTAGTFSMAVDRFGFAYVEYNDGHVFEVDTFDASCKPTAFDPAQQHYARFGMGYALNDDDPTHGETLWVAGPGLASLDTQALKLSFLQASTLPDRTELTSIGSQLFAFSIETGVLARMNKTTGATDATYRTATTSGTAAFAFAHWGGIFWLFTGDQTSTVTTYDATTDTTSVALPHTDILIVGAGSSTCAPTTAPR